MGYLLSMNCKECVTPKDWKPSWLKWQVSQPLILTSADSIHLDLGSGTRPSNPFKCKTLIISDINPISIEANDSNLSFVQISNISKIPLEDNSVDTVSAFDLLEHIPRTWPSYSGEPRNPFIEIMNEINRVLKPGGVFLAVTPAFPKPQAFQDPTHVNIISEETISYFDEKAWATTLGYGYTGKFQQLHQSWLRGAGPYLGRFPEHFTVPDKEKNSNIIYKLKILNRILRLAKKKDAFALLWVMRKTCEC
jgi:SAM-dependent methyltransferase